MESRESRSRGPGKQGDTAMKDTLVAGMLVVFAAVMLLFPWVWEPLSDAEARRMLDGE